MGMTADELTRRMSAKELGEHLADERLMLEDS